MTENIEYRPLSAAAAAAACCVSFDSTRTHTGSLHTPAVATIQQTSPHVHSTAAVGTKGQGRGLPPRRELAAQLAAATAAAAAVAAAVPAPAPAANGKAADAAGAGVTTRLPPPLLLLSFMMAGQ